MGLGGRGIEFKGQLSIELSVSRRRSSSSASTGGEGWKWQGWNPESSSLWTELSDSANTRQDC